MTSEEVSSLISLYSGRPREVYKEVKNKIIKDTSRDCGDETEDDASSLEREVMAMPLAALEVPKDRSQEVRSDIRQVRSQERSQGKPQGEITLERTEAEDTVLGSPREVYSIREDNRYITGITAQHNKTKSAMKVSITIQTIDHINNGTAIELTGELKPSDRLRELTDFECDEVYFKKIINDIKEEIRSQPKEIRQTMFMGRIHERGARATWWADMILVGITNASGVLETLFYYHESDIYQINMDAQLSPKQTELYHSTGLYGRIVTVKPKLTLRNAVAKAFRS